MDEALPGKSCQLREQRTQRGWAAGASTLEVEDVYPLSLAGIGPGPRSQRDRGNSHSQVCPIRCLGPLLTPFNSTALLGIVGDALPPCCWRHAGHVYDAVLEHNHHGALPDPQRHQESDEEYRWEEDWRDVDVSPIEGAKLGNPKVSSPSQWRCAEPAGMSPGGRPRATSAETAACVKGLHLPMSWLG